MVLHAAAAKQLCNQHTAAPVEPAQYAQCCDDGWSESRWEPVRTHKTLPVLSVQRFTVLFVGMGH